MLRFVGVLCKYTSKTNILTQTKSIVCVVCVYILYTVWYDAILMYEQYSIMRVSKKGSFMYDVPTSQMYESKHIPCGDF